MLGLEGGVPILLIRNRGHLVVELRNSKRGLFTATLRTVTATPSPLTEHIQRFAETAPPAVYIFSCIFAAS